MSGIGPAPEKLFKGRREMMRVDDEGVDPKGAEMIERERDERFLKDRDERLRQIIRQRTQPRAQPRAEDEGLRYHAARSFSLVDRALRRTMLK